MPLVSWIEVRGGVWAVLGYLGIVLGPLGTILVQLGMVLGRLGVVLGASWACIGRVLAHPRASWRRLEAILGHLGEILGGSWGGLGGSREDLGEVMRPRTHTWIHKCRQGGPPGGPNAAMEPNLEARTHP